MTLLPVHALCNGSCGGRCAVCLHRARYRDPSKPCIHLGKPTGEQEPCESCTGHVQIKLFHCAVHGRCQTSAKLLGVVACPCPHYQPMK
jgi:hypothetical protein